MRFLLKIFVLAFVVAIGYGIYQLTRPYKGFTEPVFLEFPRGTSTSDMADTLAEKGVVAKPWMFEAARVFNRKKTLQAGEYKFEKAATPFEVLSRIVRGDIFYLEFLVPEGYNIFEIETAIRKLGTIPPGEFLKAARNPALIRDLDPKAETLEGYLFPNKYRIYRHTTAQQICRIMTAEFRAQWKALGGKDAHSTVTLASLVEREAHLPEERPMVASVFMNRLKHGVKLDCDPTTVYAALLENRYRGTIYKSDLASANAYNTYAHPGLPPGPIANPGLSSIKAALHPAQTDYIYFVAKGDGSGGHNFATSLAQHEQNIALYRRATHQ